jgi:hypothetical protein
MEVMVFCKLRPASLEVHLTVPVIPDLHFIGSSSPRVFTKNCFSQLSPIYELGKLQQAPAESRGIERRRCRRSISWEKEVEKHYVVEHSDLKQQ